MIFTSFLWKCSPASMTVLFDIFNRISSSSGVHGPFFKPSLSQQGFLPILIILIAKGINLFKFLSLEQETHRRDKQLNLKVKIGSTEFLKNG